MNTTWKTITPELANEWLASNDRNRPVKQNHVRNLAREMQEGRWKENGETIKRNGTTLIDGQHRLLACIRAKTSFRSLVVEGIDSDVFDSIDSGICRSGSDTLAVLGEKNTKRLAASLIIVERYMTGTMETGTRKFSNSEIENLLLKYPKIRESVRRSDFNTRLVPPSLVSALHFLFSQKDAHLADLFMQKMLKGNELEEGDPVYVLRERLVRNSLEKAKLSPVYISALIIKAWNFMRNGQRIYHLRYRERGDSRETFPLIN